MTSTRTVLAQAIVNRVVDTGGGIVAVCGAAALVALWQSFFWLETIPPVTKIAYAVLTALCAAHPTTGLLIVSGLAPLGSPIAGLLGAMPGRGAETIVLAFLVGWASHTLVRRQRFWDSTDGLQSAAVLLGWAVVASLVVVEMVGQARTGPPGDYFRALLLAATTTYLADLNPPLHNVYAAAHLLEGLVLLVVVVLLSRQSHQLPIRIARMAVAAAAGAATLSCVRLGMGVLRAPVHLEFLKQALTSIRLSFHVSDLNAAGSHFAMISVIAFGFVLAGRRGRSVWLVATGLVLAGLWLTGSRSALAALVIAGLFWCVLATVYRNGTWRRIAIATVVAVVAGFAMLPMLPTVQNWTAGQTLMMRWYFAVMSSKMWMTAPIWGIGIGDYLQRSAEFMLPELRVLHVYENAHNNFAQIGVELGLVGLALLLWMLILAWERVRAACRGSHGDPVLMGLGCGLAAFLATWFTGHPLLVPAVACAFWLLLGATVGQSEARTGERTESASRPAIPASLSTPRRWRAWLVPIGIIVVIASVPIRVSRAIGAIAMEDVKYGFTPFWNHDPVAGRRYRIAGPEASFFVPARAAIVVLPLGGPESDGPVSVEIRVDGRLANRLRLRDRAWQDLRTVMPAGGRAGRFRRIDLLVREDAGPPATSQPERHVSLGPRVRVGEIQVLMAARPVR